MPSLAELRAELKELRKASVEHGPVSKMRKADVSAALEKLRVAREETPAPAATPSAPPKRTQPAAVSIKEAKKSEFPVMPGGTTKGEERKTARKAYEPKAAPKAAPKKKMTKAALRAMLDELSSDEE